MPLLYADDEWEPLAIAAAVATVVRPRKRLLVRYWHDGDTCMVDPVWWAAPKLGVRLQGVQAAEVKDLRPEAVKLAQDALSFCRAFAPPDCRAWFVELRFPDAHGRLLGDIELKGKRLTAELLARGLAVAYDGNGKAPRFPA